MKILYDHQKFSLQKFGGVTRYFSELMKHTEINNTFKLALLSTDNYYIQENKKLFKKLNILPDNNFKGKNNLKRKIYKINESYSKYCISNNKYDLLHPTYYDTYFIDKIKKPYVVTVHDLVYFKYKDIFPDHEVLTGKMNYLINKASRIIAISENTKKDIIEILNITPDKIDVIYHGYNISEKKETKKIPSDYILYVGERYTYKNFEFMVKSISGILKRERELKLICVGREFNLEEKKMFADLKISKQVTSISVSNDYLNSLYSNALMFIYPSLYEGFGMPILEAFANNCPVCLSNTSCLPEIAGDAALYFDPQNKESIITTVENLLYNNSISERYILEGKKRLKYFSWEKTSQSTANTYKQALS